LNYGEASYLNTFDLELVAGNNFLPDQSLRSAETLVNETMVKTLGLESAEAAVGAVFTMDSKEVKIRGVIKDFYTHFMSSKIDPFALQFDPDRNTGVAMKIETENLSATLAGIEDAWMTAYPNFLCRYRFLNDLLERQYGSFKTIFRFLGLASSLAIFIGCLGLYGLVSFMAVQRTKEIGIRKVLGATVSNIMMMFTKESVVLICIAFVIAAPLAYFLGIAMLMELPERTTPGIGLFFLTLLTSLLIAWGAVGYRSFSAAKQNPVISLRNE